jgi:hypothetical protein
MAHGATGDMAMGGGGDMAMVQSLCGHPGDTGNALGVGKFCMTLNDCANNTQANICSSLGNDPANPQNDTFFCTIYPCPMSDAGVAQCGDNAGCQCQGGMCACAPNSCIPPSDGGTNG